MSPLRVTAFEPVLVKLIMPVLPPAARLVNVCAAELFQVNVAPDETVNA